MANRLSKQCERMTSFALSKPASVHVRKLLPKPLLWLRLCGDVSLKGCSTVGTFIDFKKAYDRVYHAYLFRLLDHVGVRGRFLRMVVESYTRTKYAVRVGEYLSASFTPTQGAKQGDPLSPILFDIFINSCLQEAMPGPADGVIVCGQDT
jgi:hypothetical protein